MVWNRDSAAKVRLRDCNPSTATRETAITATAIMTSRRVNPPHNRWGYPSRFLLILEINIRFHHFNVAHKRAQHKGESPAVIGAQMNG